MPRCKTRLGALVPKMGLAPQVLKKALPDLTFFILIFVISVLAFANMFYLLVCCLLL